MIFRIIGGRTQSRILHIYKNIVTEKKIGLAGLLFYPSLTTIMPQYSSMLITQTVLCVSYHAIMVNNYYRSVNYLLQKQVDLSSPKVDERLLSADLKPFIGKKFCLIDENHIKFEDPNYKNFYWPQFGGSIEYTGKFNSILRFFQQTDNQQTQIIKYANLNDEQLDFVDMVKYNRQIRSRFMISSAITGAFWSVFLSDNISFFPLSIFGLSGFRYKLISHEIPPKTELFTPLDKSTYPYFYVDMYQNIVFTSQKFGYRKRFR